MRNIEQIKVFHYWGLIILICTNIWYQMLVLVTYAIYSTCIFNRMCLLVLYILPAGMWTVVCLHTGQTVDTYWPAFTYPCGREEEGMEAYCCNDRRCFSPCDGLLAQMGFHMGAEVVGSAAWIPRRCPVRAPCCAQTYLPLCYSSGSPDLKLRRLFLWLLCSVIWGRLQKLKYTENVCRQLNT